jgi:hypothetical protein
MKKKMLKNNVTGFIICFALFNIATGCSKSASNVNTEVSNATTETIRNGNNKDGQLGTNPLPSPSAMPTPDASPKTVQVRLTEVETNADIIDSPLPDSLINLKSGDSSFNKKTNKDGIVVFDAVPCGNDVVITAHDVENDEDVVLKSSLECKGTQVDLGVLTRPFGGKFILEQRKPLAMGYDAIKEIWQTMDGKRVPDEEVERILSRYNYGSN